MLRACAGSIAAAALPCGVGRAVEADTARTGLGLVLYCRSFQRRERRRIDASDDLFEPLAFLEHCRELGAGGMQANLGARDEAYAVALRERAARHGMYVEAIVGPPRDAGDVDRFDAEMRTAAHCGARAARTVIMPGRRYERFATLAEFRDFAARGERMLELAVPVAEKHRVPLAVENHKDQRIDERVALLRRIDSEFVGACVDTGNSVALLDDAVGTVEALAPWAHSVHLKDQGVKAHGDGFLLGDVPLGRGCLDLERMVAVLRGKRPDIRFTLELITRDPLRVPCLTEAYWATMPDVPAGDLARTLRLVSERGAEELPEVSALPPAAQVAREDANVRESLTFARERLGL